MCYPLVEKDADVHPVIFNTVEVAAKNPVEEGTNDHEDCEDDEYSWIFTKFTLQGVVSTVPVFLHVQDLY